VSVDHSAPDPGVLHRIALLLQRGGIVAGRTDTTYGLLASVNCPDALRRLVELKERPKAKPFVLLAASWIEVRAVTSHLTPVARRLGSAHWPGPLTLVLPAEEDLPTEVVAARRTVAVRIPGDDLLLDLLAAVRGPFAAPSANLSGERPAASAAEVLEIFGNGVDLVLDGGPAPASVPSTIVDCTGPHAEILRRGAVVPALRQFESR
jgi:tRNA threonylcarbamoyl adenosine modification protein (Sua5/YciO/YrdC/YwlC family)